MSNKATMALSPGKPTSPAAPKAPTLRRTTASAKRKREDETMEPAPGVVEPDKAADTQGKKKKKARVDKQESSPSPVKTKSVCFPGEPIRQIYTYNTSLVVDQEGDNMSNSGEAGSSPSSVDADDYNDFSPSPSEGTNDTPAESLMYYPSARPTGLDPMQPITATEFARLMGVARFGGIEHGPWENTMMLDIMEGVDANSLVYYDGMDVDDEE